MFYKDWLKHLKAKKRTSKSMQPSLKTSQECDINFYRNDTLLTQNAPSSVASADFNGDGYQDLAVTNFGGNSVSVYFGNGDGTFSEPTNYSTGTFTSPIYVVVGDFNGDGNPDFAVSNYETNKVGIYLNNGDGTFNNTNNVSTGSLKPRDIAVADFNGDGKLDLAVATQVNQVLIFFGDGIGGFPNSTTVTLPSLPQGAVLANILSGDFNNDGKQDFAVTSSIYTVYVVFGDGTGGFGNSVPYTVTNGNLSGIAMLGQDLVVGATIDNKLIVLKNDGNGNFTTSQGFNVDYYPVSVAVADFNGDGIDDLASSNIYYNTISILLGNGDGTFSDPCNFTVGDFPIALVAQDFNEDGKTDLSVLNANDENLFILLNGTPPPITRGIKL